MKTFKKRLSAVLLSVYMVFGVVSTDYLTAQAFEWVVPSLTVGESLLWLMGLLGITYTQGASSWREVSPEYEQDFIDYANEHGLNYTVTSTWLNDTASGKLNQVSQVWSTFKEWVYSLVTSSTVSGSYTGTVGDLFDSVKPNYFIYSGNLEDTVINANFGYYSFIGDTLSEVVVFTNVSDVTFSINPSFNNAFQVTLTFGDNSKRIYKSGNTNRVDSSVVSGSNTFRLGNSDSTYSNYLYYIFPFDNNFNYSDLAATYNPWSVSDTPSDTDFDTYNPALIPDISFADSNTEDASIPGVIDLPWGNLGDDEDERDKTYDDLVGGLDLGQEIGDLWQALQDLMGVLAVDDAGVLQPNDGGENPPTLDDEVENNKVNGAFVLTGLEKVFPFCIPFDLYAFITLLEAPPVAPVIEFPIYNPVTDSNDIITIDFSTWESVVVLFRYIFDFLFIIGLLLMARALIGGGDSA